MACLNINSLVKYESFFLSFLLIFWQLTKLNFTNPKKVPSSIYLAMNLSVTGVEMVEE